MAIDSNHGSLGEGGNSMPHLQFHTPEEASGSYMFGGRWEGCLSLALTVYYMRKSEKAIEKSKVLI